VLAADLNKDGRSDLVVLTDANPNLPEEICGGAHGGTFLDGSIVELILGSFTGGTPKVRHLATDDVGIDLALGDNWIMESCVVGEPSPLHKLRPQPTSPGVNECNRDVTPTTA
jgi:hypothetical protein